MAHSLSQQQQQQQVQKQKLTTQQMQFMQMLEMPLAQVEQNVMAELNDNPALDIDANADMAEHRLHSASAYDGAQDSDSDFDDQEGSADDEATNEWDFDTNGEREDRQSALQEALENIGFDDRM
ncbi:MAG: hypothetical protein HUK08_07550, partial [Bacteroidaceae bacterium]|nr:hypothetical protein [Bacteroidaceae bacterium]